MAIPSKNHVINFKHNKTVRLGKLGCGGGFSPQTEIHTIKCHYVKNAGVKLKLVNLL